MPTGRLVALLLTLALVGSACSSSGSDASPTTDSTSSPQTTSTTSDSSESGTGPTLVEPDPPPPLGDLRPFFTKLSEPGVGGRITSIAFDHSDPDRVFIGGDMLGIAVTDDFGETWQATEGLVSWEIGDITTSASADGRIWTGSLSGPQASADGGLTWQLARTGFPELSQARYTMPIESILVDPSDANHLLAFNGNQRNWNAPGAYASGTWQGDGSVWESTDSGATWSTLATVAPGGNSRAATFVGSDPDRLLAAVANRGVWSSADGGTTWTEASSGLPHFNAYDVTAHPTEPGVAWVAMGEGPLNGNNHVPGGIWRTDDFGSTWLPANEGLSIVANATPGNTGSFHQIVSAPTDPDRLYTSNVAPGQAAVYRSDDGGQSWRVIADGSTRRPDAYQGALRAFDIGVHPSDPDRVVIGSDDTILGTTDGGSVWTDLTTLEDRSGFFAGRGYSGLVATDIVFNPRDPDDAILLAFDGGNFIQTVDGGETWRRTVQNVSQWGGGVEAVYSPTNPDRLYVLLGQFSNFRGIGISSDGGDSFQLAAGPDFGLPPVSNVSGGARGIAALSSGGADIVLAVVGSMLYRSADSGMTFSAVAGVSDVRDVAVSGSGELVYAATADGVLVSTDLGLTFNGAGDSPAGITTLYPSASEDLAIYAVAFRDGEGGAYRFDGATWTYIFDDEFAHGLAVDPSNPDNIAIVTSEPAFHDVSNATGVHLSDDGGASWTPIVAGLPMTRLRAAEFDPGETDRLVVGTTGRGFYDISFSQALGE
ncbi:MAG: WD40/YVTN/BNR-like repeat-containing protein [Acidimicrobiales bacterium]